MSDRCARDRCGGALEGSGVWCSDCTGRLDVALRELPGLFVGLLGGLVPSGGRGEPVSGSRSPKVPLRLSLLALAQDVARLACWCEDALRGPLRRPRRFGGRSYHLRGCTRALGHVRGHQGALLTLGDGPVAAEALLAVHSAAVSALGLGALVHRLHVPCPSCNGRLSRENGADHVVCSGCGRLWRQEEYDWLVRITVAEMPEPAA